MHGPSAPKKSTKRGVKPGNAAKLSIRTTTRGLIAYTAMQVRLHEL
jgi:hypothetical protein